MVRRVSNGVHFDGRMQSKCSAGKKTNGNKSLHLSNIFSLIAKFLTALLRPLSLSLPYLQLIDIMFQSQMAL